MKLRKDKWKKVKIGGFTNITTGKLNSSSADNNGIYPFFTCSKDILWINHFAYDCEALLLAGNNATADYDVKYYKGKFNAYQRTYIITIPNKNIEYAYLKILLEKNLAFLKESSIGTQTKYLKLGMIQNIEIPLPPLDEQERIVGLFQSVEQSIIQTEQQEQSLKLLQKTLSNGLASKKPIFGNLLSDKNCTLHSFSDISHCIEQHDKTPLGNGLTRFIGLENIEPENFTLQGFGNIEDGTTFIKRFSKNDVLFGKRRAYLKKVAIADFDGICSSDILVFRAIEKEILPELLPYYVSSDAFMNLAVSTSAGSLSPRTKWRDLAGFQLSIPDIKTQEKMVDVLNQLSQSLQLLGQQKETLKKLKQKLLNEILG